MPISLWLPSLYFGLRTSLIFGASSANWFSLLVSIELNLIIILPILFYSSNLISREGVITYLLAQSAGSLMILLCLLVEPPMILVVHNLDLLLLSGIVLKLGVCPLHFWFLSIVSFSNRLNFFLLSTTQKFLPLLILMNLEMDGFFLLLVLTGCLVPVINLISNKVKAMLAYSSVFQMVMLIVAIQISNKTGLFYYATYCLTLVPVCY